MLDWGNYRQLCQDSLAPVRTQSTLTLIKFWNALFTLRAGQECLWQILTYCGRKNRLSFRLFFLWWCFLLNLVNQLYILIEGLLGNKRVLCDHHELLDLQFSLNKIIILLRHCFIRFRCLFDHVYSHLGSVFLRGLQRLQLLVLPPYNHINWIYPRLLFKLTLVLHQVFIDFIDFFLSLLWVHLPFPMFVLLSKSLPCYTHDERIVIIAIKTTEFNATTHRSQ